MTIPVITNELICNMALAHLRITGETVTDLATDTSEVGKLCNRFLLPLAGQLLRERQWNFAKRAVRLAQYEDDTAVVNLLSDPEDLTAASWLAEGDTPPTLVKADTEATPVPPWGAEHTLDAFSWPDSTGMAVNPRLRQANIAGMEIECPFRFSLAFFVMDGGGTASFRLTTANTTTDISVADDGAVNRYAMLAEPVDPLAPVVSVRHIGTSGAREVAVGGALLTAGLASHVYPAVANKAWSAMGRWGYAYRAPADMVTAVGFLDGTRGRNTMPHQWELHTLDDGQVAILADVPQADAFFSYTADVTSTPAVYTWEFAEALSYLLGDRIGGPLTINTNVRLELAERGRRALDRAAARDADIGEPVPDHDSDLIRSRA